MLVPIMGLYFFSNQTSSRVLREELNRSNKDQLSFFQNQVDNTTNPGLIESFHVTLI